MKEFTKKLYAEREEDLAKLRYRNNSKDEKRTAEQIRQSAKDQANKYTDKWNRLLEQCETPAQKGICKDVLHRISIHFNHGLVVADVKEKEQKQEQEQAEEQRKEFRKIVAQTGLSLAKFAERYEIPRRSVENWSGGQRTAPDYLIKLLARVVAEDFPE